MKRWLLVVLMLVSVQFFGQKTSVDLAKIQQNIKSKESPYFSERIIYRFRGIPFSLDNAEALHLYFGRNFTDVVKFEDPEFKELAQAYRDKNIDECLRLGKELYQKDPTNLDILMILLNAYTVTRNQKQFGLHLSQFQLLINAIKSTGDGKSKKSAYLVNSVGDEYILLNVLTKGEKYERRSKVIKDGVLDIWEKDKEKIYIKVLYL